MTFRKFLSAVVALVVVGTVGYRYLVHQLPVSLDPQLAEKVQTQGSEGIEAEVGLPELIKQRPEQIIHHTGYTVSYNEDLKIPNWVAWILTPERFQDAVSRTDDFLPDPSVDDPVTTDDYKHSGYDRGHMCPAADNKWNEQAMKESFYMTNICPQNHNLNRGDWKELEDACREWTYQNKTLYVVCGPLLYNNHHKTIGLHKVVVPDAFYKVVLSLTPPKAIGFVYRNTSGNKPLDSYVNSVDQVERLAGIDFFPELPDSVESKVEAECDISDWEFPAP